MADEIALDVRRTLRGAGLLYAAIARILECPQSWDQTVVWHSPCGTRHCIFGWCEIVAGIRTRPDRTFDEVRQLLGLSATDAAWLAAPERTLAQIRWFADELAAGRVNGRGEGFDVKAYDRLTSKFRQLVNRKLRQQRIRSRKHLVSLV